jgi:hypothetical protein
MIGTSSATPRTLSAFTPTVYSNRRSSRWRRLPLSQPHELQRELGRHAPQRNEQCERRRYQHNRRLELGRVGVPLRDVGVHVVAYCVTQGPPSRTCFGTIL